MVSMLSDKHNMYCKSFITFSLGIGFFCFFVDTNESKKIKSESGQSGFSLTLHSAAHLAYLFEINKNTVVFNFSLKDTRLIHGIT